MATCSNKARHQLIFFHTFAHELIIFCIFLFVKGLFTFAADTSEQLVSKLFISSAYLGQEFICSPSSLFS